MAERKHQSAFRDARKAAQITQKEVAEMSGTLREYVVMIEGGRRTPSAKLAALLLDNIKADKEVRAACVREWAGDWLAVLEGG